ncbi:MAG: peptide deformylase [Actinomycetia bacterium]|nr:peptide deformylase [Actinomycetes bacterium]
MFNRSKRLQLRLHPDPILAQISAEVAPAEIPGLSSLIASMGQTMYDNEGCGLAAIQVGVPRRLIVYDISEEQDDLQALINPRIVDLSADCETSDEGCLSFPGLYKPVERSFGMRIEALDASGKSHSIEVEGFLARVLQHEIDHLEGVTMLDHLDPTQRQQALREYFGLQPALPTTGAHAGAEL